MKVYFGTGINELEFIKEVENLDAAFATIQDTIKEIGFDSYYLRSGPSKRDGFIWVDYGSWLRKFYIDCGGTHDDAEALLAAYYSKDI